MKKKRPKKRQVPVNPYAMQTRNATVALPPAVVVQPRRKRFVQAARRVGRRAANRAIDRATSRDFLAETGLNVAGGGLAALGMGALTSNHWNPYAVGALSAVAGVMGATLLPGVWKGMGQGALSAGVGQIAAAAVHQYAAHRAAKKIEEEQKKAAQQGGQGAGGGGSGGQKALPEPPKPAKPANAYFGPDISDVYANSQISDAYGYDAYANARSYGRYGRADDEERMTDLDLALG